MEAKGVWEDVLLFAAVGLAAQVIDGALGMAYGVTATTVLANTRSHAVTRSKSPRARLRLAR